MLFFWIFSFKGVLPIHLPAPCLQLEDRFATWQALPTAELCHTLAAKQAELEVAKAEYFQWLTTRKRQKCG